MRKQKFVYISIIAFIIFFIPFFWINYFSLRSKKPNKDVQGKIRYVTIGDSYTIGLGVEEKNNWPNLLVRHLKKKGVDIDLIINPAVSGFTVRDAIEYEIPIVEKTKPDFITVLIGANDNFMEKSKDVYREDLGELLDKLQSIQKESKNIILITIPDYSKSPSIQGRGRKDLSAFIDSYNNIIKEEGKKRELKIVDIFPVSQTMTKSDDYINDGLHPSSAGYTKWEGIIFPIVYDFLKTL